MIDKHITPNTMNTSIDNMNFRHLAQIARRKNTTKVKPSGKVYNRRNEKYKNI